MRSPTPSLSSANRRSISAVVAHCNAWLSVARIPTLRQPARSQTCARRSWPPPRQPRSNALSVRDFGSTILCQLTYSSSFLMSTCDASRTLAFTHICVQVLTLCMFMLPCYNLSCLCRYLIMNNITILPPSLYSFMSTRSTHLRPRSLIYSIEQCVASAPVRHFHLHSLFNYYIIAFVCCPCIMHHACCVFNLITHLPMPVDYVFPLRSLRQ